MKIQATYTPAEVARLLGRPKSTVHKWVKLGKLLTVELCGQKVVPLEALRVPGMVWESIVLAARLNEATRSGNAAVAA